MCMYVYVCVSVCLYVGSHRGQKRVLDPMEQELQAVVNIPTWILGPKSQISARVVDAFNH